MSDQPQKWRHADIVERDERIKELEREVENVRLANVEASMWVGSAKAEIDELRQRCQAYAVLRDEELRQRTALEADRDQWKGRAEQLQQERDAAQTRFTETFVTYGAPTVPQN